MQPVWRIPNKQTQIHKGAVHIWRATLEVAIRDIRSFVENLSYDERLKAARFRFERDRNRYIVSFGILKSILGLYTGVDPCLVEISYGSHGKPRLTDAYGKRNIHFNLSRSEDLAIYVFARDSEVGVDIERIRDFPEMEEIVEDFFSLPEKDYFTALPRSKRREAFFCLWTRKEAYIKAIGEGLHHPLDSFDASLITAESDHPPYLEGDPKATSPWLIQDLEPAPGFASAYAVNNRSWIIHYWQWVDPFIKDLETK